MFIRLTTGVTMNALNDAHIKNLKLKLDVMG